MMALALSCQNGTYVLNLLRHWVAFRFLNQEETSQLVEHHQWIHPDIFSDGFD
jgi:hypothetical protein